MPIVATSGIYKIEHLESGKVYIGSAVDFRIRWRNHLSTLRRGIHRSILLQRAWNKHGAHAFTFEILEHVEKKSLIAREQQWIWFFDAANPARGYNVQPIAGSSMGRVVSEATKALIASRAKERWQSPELRAKYLETHRGMLGKKHKPESLARMAFIASGRTHSAESRAKIAAASKARGISKETRAQMAASSRGKQRSAEQKNRIAVAMLGNQNTKGYKHSDETLAKWKLIAKSRERGPDGLFIAKA